MKKFFTVTLMTLIFLVDSVSAQLPVSEQELSQILGNTRTVGKTDQIILVVDHSLSLWNEVNGVWKMDFETYCGYGKNGLSHSRWAGDKTTPIGSFPILYAFGKANNPGTEMEYRKITPYSYLSSEYSTYNQWVESAYGVSGEHLIDYYQYKYAMNIGYNVNPTEYGRGAAIFLHCKSYDRWWTSGCVSVPEEVMLKLVRKAHNGEYMIIVPNVEEIFNW